MRLLACGGRDFNDYAFVAATLDRIHAKRQITLLIEGGAFGADTLARMWAIRNGVRYVTEHADWHIHGKRAGFIRNGTMLADHKPDGVCAFPGGRGTADMVKQARKAGVTVWEVPYPEDLC